MSSRTLAGIAAVIFVVSATLVVLVRPASAESISTGDRILQIAQQSLHEYEGQCFPWVRRVVAEATGRQMGFGYRDGYLSGGAIEVPVSEAQPGDILQIADDANHGPGVNYAGLHTSIVMQREDDGQFTVIDSNSKWDGIVRVRPDYDPYAAAARYPNLNVRAYRFAAVDEAPTQATQTQSASLAPGTTARVAGDGECVNLRSAPSLSATRIHCVADGSFVEVLDDAPVNAGGYRWVPVQTGWGVGWMADAFLVAVSSTPTTTPTPTPTPDSSTPISGTPGSITGSLPTQGGIGIVLWSGGSVETFVVQAVAGGCSVRSLWTTVEGRFVGYTAGAPAFVNAQWRTRYPGDLPSSPFILICASEGTSAPPASPPPSTGSPPASPEDGMPPGPAGNDD